jgi:sulfur-oxidizing protein SoxA
LFELSTLSAPWVAALLVLLGILPGFSGEIAPAAGRSAYADMSRETKAMQDDDTANPAMLSVLDGEALWNRKDGSAQRSCADCHGDAAASMKGVAARYPAFDAASGGPVDLEARINSERRSRQGAPPWRFESDELLALSAYVARQSRGEPIAPPADESVSSRSLPQAAICSIAGRASSTCPALCHDDNWGKRLAGNIVPQGHPTGYPIYRLEWQSIGSLQRRLRNCISGMRAQTPDYGAADYVNLELFLMQRAAGDSIGMPAVRP